MQGKAITTHVLESIEYLEMEHDDATLLVALHDLSTLRVTTAGARFRELDFGASPSK